MLHQPTIDKMLSLRLQPLVDAWRGLDQDENTQALSFEEKLGLMVDRLWIWRQNQALERRLRSAKLRTNACVEDIDYHAARGLDRNQVRSLASDPGWVQRHENIFILGPTGVGKSFLACALAQKACRDGFLVLYTRASALFRDLALARADGSLRNLLARLARVDVLVVDDWAMAPLQETERRDFWEICEERYRARSTILASQVPVAQWHEQIGDPTFADGILDRLVHNAHRIELRGDSMRKLKASPKPKSR
jgi:DNA replication protein DnaC